MERVGEPPHVMGHVENVRECQLKMEQSVTTNCLWSPAIFSSLLKLPLKHREMDDIQLFYFFFKL